jgi:hypothetical protein
MSVVVDMVGLTFARLEVVSRIGTTNDGQAIWKCRCVCGAIVPVTGGHLRTGHTRSCGCLHQDQGAPYVKHGRYRAPEYRTWSAMKSRCSNRNVPAFKDYGGRGITVCERWMKFENFLADMGVRPTGTSLDRYPNCNGNYEPGNCRWATPREQTKNRRPFGTAQVEAMRMALGLVADFCRRASEEKVHIQSLPSGPQEHV